MCFSLYTFFWVFCLLSWVEKKKEFVVKLDAEKKWKDGRSWYEMDKQEHGNRYDTNCSKSKAWALQLWSSTQVLDLFISCQLVIMLTKCTRKIIVSCSSCSCLKNLVCSHHHPKRVALSLSLRCRYPQKGDFISLFLSALHMQYKWHTPNNCDDIKMMKQGLTQTLARQQSK